MLLVFLDIIHVSWCYWYFLIILVFLIMAGISRCYGYILLLLVFLDGTGISRIYFQVFRIFHMSISSLQQDLAEMSALSYSG